MSLGLSSETSLVCRANFDSRTLGSAGTIGRALAECFAVAGAKLVLIFNRTPAKPEFKEQCTKLGASSVTFIQCNISDLTSCRELVAKTEKSVGSIDVLINNAGVDHLGPAALIRLTSCWQLELDLTGYDDIHMYALHPGAVPSELTSSGSTAGFFAEYPHVGEMLLDTLKNFKDSPYLSGMASVALATGIAKGALKGKYFDVQQDLDDVITQASEIRADPELYTLNTKFLGDLENDGGTEKRPAEDPFHFPGF
ncbi:hypothetical protein FOFC_07991 [Fusarium oxysporum]|nr:hypothetical protein FOFC_07991 [Fusarium oxysporum]